MAEWELKFMTKREIIGRDLATKIVQFEYHADGTTATVSTGEIREHNGCRKAESFGGRTISRLAAHRRAEQMARLGYEEAEAEDIGFIF